MSQPGIPTPPELTPPLSRRDLAISVGALVVTAVFGGVASVLGLFSLAFLDNCPPDSCSVDGAVTAVGTALMVALAIGLLGLIVTVVQLFRRKPAWPFAVATLVLCMLAVGCGVIGYGAAVGG